MKPSFQQIAELFQIEVPSPSADITVPRKLKGENASECAELGRLALADGDFESAVRHYREAIEKGDSNSEIDLAAALEYGDQAPQAFRQYLKVKRASGLQPEALVGISGLYRRYGKYRDSIDHMQAAIALDPGNPFLQFKLAEMFSDMGERMLALVAAQKAVELKPEDPFYHYWMGDLLLEMQRFDEALDAFRAAIELSPGDDHLYLRASVAFWRQSKEQEAIKAIRLAGDLDPEKRVYHGLLQALLEKVGMDEEARLEQKRADQMDRYDRDILSRVLVEMGIE
jgi:tetratricopeptide (TPR) repeat protein